MALGIFFKAKGCAQQAKWTVGKSNFQQSLGSYGNSVNGNPIRDG